MIAGIFSEIRKRRRQPRHECARCQAQPHREEVQREVERLLQENEELRRKVTERDKQITEQQKQISEREKQISDQQKQITDLERQLAGRRKDSSNSSKPPSSDQLIKPSRLLERRQKSKRKPGGQKGHPGQYRPLVPLEQVREVRPVLPEHCQHCGRHLPQQITEVETVGELHRHQVTELPAIQPYTIEYQCHKVVCPDCGEGTRAPLPEEVRGLFGPQLIALIAYLTVVCRMPRRVLEAFLEQILNIPISLGSTQNAWEQASQAVAQPYEELQEQLRHEPVLHSDETGWRSNGDKRYLWALVGRRFVFYTVAKNRSSQVLIYLCGAVFAGILCSDRFGAYFKYHKNGIAQLCWAHLKRDILGIQDFSKTTDADRFCRNALALYARLFRLWRKFQSQLIDREQLMDRSMPLQKDWYALAKRYLDSEDKEVRNLATALFKHSDRLFAFLEHPGVEPTNNCVERALRIAVQWRKTSFGNRSARGEVATARLLTVTQTCKKQGQNALVYLREAIGCHRRRQPAPSLLTLEK